MRFRQVWISPSYSIACTRRCARGWGVAGLALRQAIPVALTVPPALDQARRMMPAGATLPSLPSHGPPWRQSCDWTWDRIAYGAVHGRGHRRQAVSEPAGRGQEALGHDRDRAHGRRLRRFCAVIQIPPAGGDAPGSDDVGLGGSGNRRGIRCRHVHREHHGACRRMHGIPPSEISARCASRLRGAGGLNAAAPECCARADSAAQAGRRPAHDQAAPGGRSPGGDLPPCSGRGRQRRAGHPMLGAWAIDRVAVDRDRALCGR